MLTNDNAKASARKTLDSYLETNNHRKTPERYAVLDAVYDIDGHFTLDELEERLRGEARFPVSRGTLYNALRLFTELHLVVRHSLGTVAKYEACRPNDSHCHEICTVCGRMTELHSAAMDKAIGELPLGGFHGDGYSLYIYGVCPDCQAKAAREDNKKKII